LQIEELNIKARLKAAVRNMVIDDKPSYSKLMANINLMHPRKDGGKFSICEDLGHYPCCCRKQAPVS